MRVTRGRCASRRGASSSCSPTPPSHRFCSACGVALEVGPAPSQGRAARRAFRRAVRSPRVWPRRRRGARRAAEARRGADRSARDRRRVVTGCVIPPWETLQRGSGAHPTAPRATDARTSAAAVSGRPADGSRAASSGGSQSLASRPRLPARPRRRRTAAGAGSRTRDGEAASRRTGRGRGAGSCARKARLPLPRRLELGADRGRGAGREQVGPSVARASSSSSPSSSASPKRTRTAPYPGPPGATAPSTCRRESASPAAR